MNLLRLLKEKRKRLTLLRPDLFLDHKFPAQYKVNIDKSLRKAINVTRRGGKTTGFARECAMIMVSEKSVNLIYGALTVTSAKKILWDEMILIIESRGFTAKPNHQDNTIMIAETGSKLHFFGVDSSYKEMKKLLGQRVRKAGIDEAGSMTVDMIDLCYQMIEPALIDLGGDLSIFGTCEKIPNTFFQKVVEGKEKGWSVHRWTTHENPYMAEKWAARIELLIKENPDVVKASWFRTHYLNEWVTDDNLIILPCARDNVVDPIELKDYYLNLGVDIGYNDDCSYTVYAWSNFDLNGYVVKSFKIKGQDITDTAESIKKIVSEFPITRIRIDGSNKQAVEEMKKRHGLNLTNAEKTEKADFLHLMSDEFKRGRVKFFKGECEPLLLECDSLIWQDEFRLKEHPNCANHSTDSLLYIWRDAYNYINIPKIDTPSRGSEAEMDQYFDQLSKQLQGSDHEF